MFRNLWLTISNKEYRQSNNEVMNLTEHSICTSEVRLEGKTVLVTGGNSGIGKECCRDFIKRGARVILACRSTWKGDAAKKEIEEDTGIYGNLIVMNVDLASLRSVRNFAEEFKKNENRLDILLNNAGLTAYPERFTEDGFEAIMACNHLGHFLLTYLLIDLLKSSAPSRIVNVASAVHFACTDMKFNDFHDKGGCCSCCATDDWVLYARAKAANVMFTQELARKFSGDGITAYSLHPGVVSTNFLNKFDSCCAGCFYKIIMNPNLRHVKTPIQGAQTSLHCCLAEGIESHSGGYFTECKPHGVSKLCRDEENAQKLWNLSNNLVGAKW